MSGVAAGILSRASGELPASGTRVEAALDRAVLSGARGPSTLLQVRDRGRPWSSESLLLAMDFQAPEVESRVPRSRALCRELAGTYGLRHVFDLNTGIGSHVVVESGLVLPGQLVAGSGRCLGVLGGIGALPLRLEPEALAQAIVSGRVPVEVPLAVRVTFQGKLPRYLGAWDLAHAVAGRLGSRLQGRVVELEPGSGFWDIDFRMGLCGLLVEMGAFCALVSVDEVVAKFYKGRGVEIEVPEAASPDPGGYEAVVTVEADSVVPVTGADYGGPVSRLPAADGAPVQGVFAGGCYGGRYQDLALVAEVLKKAQVHPEARLVISPATLETARAALASGFYETFLNAGAMITVPGGGPGSAGGGAIFGEGERIASTAEYHRQLDPGQGVPEVHLLSAAAAAVAATEGRLTDPTATLS